MDSFLSFCIILNNNDDVDGMALFKCNDRREGMGREIEECSVVGML